MERELSALEKSLLNNINKKFGKDNPMVQLGEESDYGKIKGWVDTGILAMNWLISGKLEGGYPVGRISEFAGDPGTGKSLLCGMALADPSIDLIVYFDTEAAMNIDFLKFLGVDPSKILYQPIDTVEQIMDAAQEVLDTIILNKSSKKVIMIIDSIALASTDKEMDPEGGKDMGNKAYLLRSFFRTYARKIEKHNIALLVTNHYTQTIGRTYGPSKVTTGGTALPYAASVRIDLKQIELEIDKKLEALGASSVTIQATTIKNRCFSPKRKISFILDFERGVDRYSGLLQILIDLGIAKKNGGWCMLPQWNPEKKFYAKDFPRIIRDNNLIPLIQSLLDEKVKRDVSEEIDIEGEAIEGMEKLENGDVTETKKDKKKKMFQALEEANAPEERVEE